MWTVNMLYFRSSRIWNLSHAPVGGAAGVICDDSIFSAKLDLVFRTESTVPLQNETWENMATHASDMLHVLVWLFIVAHWAKSSVSPTFSHRTLYRFHHTVLETVGLAKSLSKRKHLSWMSRDLSSIPKSHIERKTFWKLPFDLLVHTVAHRYLQSHTTYSYTHMYAHACTHSHSAHTYNIHTEEKLRCKINFSMWFDSI